MWLVFLEIGYKVSKGCVFVKLLVASDIHGSLSAARHVVEAFEKEQADYLVFLGDVMYHGPRNPLPDEYNPSEVARLLNTIKNKIIAVRGNCDSEVDQMLLEFQITADYQNIPLPSNRLFATHGHIFEPETIPASVKRGDIFAFGHTHIPVLEMEESGILVLNPGSAALPKQGHPPTYGIVSEKIVEIKTFDGNVYRAFAIS